VLSAGPQSKNEPHTPPSQVSRKLQSRGVKVFAVGVGNKAPNKEVIGIASGGDYALKINYPELPKVGPIVAPAIKEGIIKYCSEIIIKKYSVCRGVVT